MVTKPEPIFAAVEAALGDPPRLPVILLASRAPVHQERAWQLAQAPGCRVAAAAMRAWMNAYASIWRRRSSQSATTC